MTLARYWACSLLAAGAVFCGILLPQLQAGENTMSIPNGIVDLGDDALIVAVTDPRGFIAIATLHNAEILFANTMSEAIDAELELRPGGHGSYPLATKTRLYAGEHSLELGHQYVVVGIVIGQGTVSLLGWVEVTSDEANADLARYRARASDLAEISN